MFSFLQICCPNNAVNPPKCDPKVPKCDYNDYDEESESFGYKCCGFINDEIRELDEFWYGTCQNGTVCTSAVQCGIKGIYILFGKFSSVQAPRHCNGILLPKLFWPTVRKNCSSVREKLLKFEAEGWEFANFLRSLEFIQTVRNQTNFW